MFKTKQDPELRRDMMLNGKLSRIIPKMAIPSIISLLISSFYNLVDSFFVKQLGTAAVGAVGISLSLEQLVSIFGSAIGMGASSYISRLLGAKKDLEAEHTLAASFFTTLALGILLGALGLIFIEPILRFVGATETILPNSVTYSSYTLFAAPVMVSSFVLNQSLRAEGSPIFSMFGLTFGAILNCILDPLFIFTFGWGLAGAASATAISKLVSFTILLFPYLRGRSIVRLRFKSIRFTKTIVTEVGKMSIPIFARSALTSFVAIITNNTAASFGDAAIAAMSIANRAMHFFASGLMGFGQGYQPVAGFNWGAKRYDRVTEAFWFAIKVGVLVMAVVCAPIFIFAREFTGLFSDDLSVLEIAVFSVRTHCIAMPIGAIVVVINMSFTAQGRAIGSTLLGLSRQGICFLPAVLIIPRFFGVMGLAAAQACADFLSVLIGIPLAVIILRDIKIKKQEQAELIQSQGKI